MPVLRHRDRLLALGGLATLEVAEIVTRRGREGDHRGSR